MRQLTVQEVRHSLEHASFAVLSHVNREGEPRSSGVLHRMSGGRMSVVVAKDSWKARHIAACGAVAVTVPVHRGGVRLCPPDVRADCSVVEITPAGHFGTYGIGSPPSKMRDRAASYARLPVRSTR
ncbi:pyridoxamine 5'-phosphate oxidase family protein [Paractinoplanes ferrugineus]|uniref:Pyridoxamine 5'-phosphate oxidase putative domain-containing protein n=1 Tax=Paractinoplanes ferrugineus TaxID=113564 RepID=A0A919MAU1_9ACTN|nr:hypothetical protein [Actinoplanes ferrugineus]GIE12946.1 hypothetical protein Afe05nite_47860 [Actinoplanes ferrugineus]